ncbi:MAG: hypothetical protein QUV05_08475 [Phycisphaerae bacterium]|nr:hypothetical protein [Phycisphaerae bacterium]
MRKTRLHRVSGLARLLAVWVAWSSPISSPAQAALPPAEASSDREAVLVVQTRPAAPVETGIAELTRVLQGKGLRVARATALATDNRTHVVIGQAGTSPVLDRLLEDNGGAVSRLPESVCIKRLPAHSPPAILIAGSDARGVMYGLLEAARSVELAGRGADPFSGIADAAESPDLAMRSVSLSLYNADLEREWYFKEEFWRAYQAMLAGNRFNNFTLVFANQTSYLNPPYPFLVEVPEHPEVKAIGVSGQERQRNLHILRTISGMARDHGIDFTLGVWMHRPKYGPSMVEGITRGDDQRKDAPLPTDYCARALRRVLQECPAINGVQYRMNQESGVPEDRQTEFFAAQFRAIRDCGRPVRLELRYKGLRPSSIQAARDAGLDPTISTKYWCEFMGLPYHPTVEDRQMGRSYQLPHDRYGYGDLLRYPRPYRVLYQLWTVGSQRLLLWGDPEYAARFARSCHLGGGEGFEIFAPLNNKGMGNQPGTWRIFTDSSREHYTYEYERYWMFYLAFGRLGYNPGTSPEVWRREFAHRFGEAAQAVEMAYRSASQISPFFVAAHLLSASEFGYWPEMDTGGPLEAYMCTPPSDTAQFYAIRPFQPVPGTRDRWQTDIVGYVADAVNGNLRAKWTPFRIAERLRQLSRQTFASLEEAKSSLRDPPSPEFRSTVLDLSITANLAIYHAEKMTAGTHVEFFNVTGEAGRLPKALEHISHAAAAWEKIVRLTDGVYSDKLMMTMSSSPQHWRNSLPQVNEDVAYVKSLLQKYEDGGGQSRTFPGESRPVNPPRIEHTPITSAPVGSDLRIRAQVTSPDPLRRVILHYRLVNQGVAWKEIDMRPANPGRFEAVIPGSEITAQWDLMYYLEALVRDGGSLWPSWEEGPPYVVVTPNRNESPRVMGSTRSSPPR